MSEQICDYCGVARDEQQRSWRRLEYVAGVSPVTEDTRDKHFCSDKCVREFSKRMLTESKV